MLCMEDPLLTQMWIKSFEYRTGLIDQILSILATFFEPTNFVAVFKLPAVKQYFNPLITKRRLLYLKTQSVPRSKHFSSRL